MIVIGICTRKRPKMLAALLESLAQMQPLLDDKVTCIVVENGPPDGAQAIVQVFADRLNISWFNEPKVGLVHARNAVIERFLETDGGWLGFVDDDETVAPDWLVEMARAQANFLDAAAFIGPKQFIFTKQPPQVISAIRQPALKHGQLMRFGGTANAMVARSVFDVAGYGLRFDPVFNLCGGEDGDLFIRLGDRGGVVRFVGSAIVYETQPAERSTLGYRMRRWRHHAHNAGQSIIYRRGQVYGRLIIMGRIIRSFTRAISYMAFGLVALVFF